jgi:hypothetical protein
MNKAKTAVTLLAVLLLMSFTASPQALRAEQGEMANWAGKYPDDKFFNHPPIKGPLRRVLSKADYASIGDYNLMTPIKRVGHYLVANSEIKYSDPQKTLSLAFDLEGGAVYVVFREGEGHRGFSTEGNRFDLPEEVLEEIGL